MKLQKRLAILLTAACLILAMGVSAYAHEAVDMKRTGSLSVTMKYGGNRVPGGALTLYRVADVFEEDGNYGYVLTEAFQGSKATLNIETMDASALADMAEALKSYAFENNLTGKTVTIDSNGVAYASGLKLGLYLIVQTEAAAGYEPVHPFLVSIPMNEDGKYLYDVDATPKMGTLTEKTPEEPEEPENPETPETPTTPGTPETPGGTLPQTGQLNWPVPVLAFFGLCLLLTGWVLRADRREKPYEA